MAGVDVPTRAPEWSLWLVERVARRWYPLVVFALGTIALASGLLPRPHPLRDWPWLFVTGIVTWLVALPLALRLPDKLTEALTRLVNRKVLVGGPDLVAFLDTQHRKARWSALAGAVVAVGAIVLSFVLVYYTETTGFWVLLAFETVAAVPVGLFGGRAASYGFLGIRLVRAGFELRPDPDHLDSAAGLRPIGALFFFSASVLAVPGAFLACWWVLIPLFPEYSVWRAPYAVMLLIVVAAQVLAFLLPMQSFHRLMLRRRAELFAEADALSDRAVQASAEPDENWQRRYHAIEAMATWPVDARMRRRFGIRNLVLLLPVFAQVVGASKPTQDLLDVVRKALSG
jgi:MFS family permease